MFVYLRVETHKNIQSFINNTRNRNNEILYCYSESGNLQTSEKINIHEHNSRGNSS